MKINYRIITLLLLIIFSGCRKKEDNSPLVQIEGKWVLVKITGGISGQGSPVTNKQEIIFHHGTYRLFVNDAEQLSASYTLKQTDTPDGKMWLLETGSQFKNYIEIKNNLLTMMPAEIIDANGAVYARVY
ncbi:hypothetical protein ACTJJ0_16430 [Chitinophaga sp. 22321]|uniref:Lipocalin-like domain-containing protein n=1 Tax=Chitinophaga hostae TaxID=2831022 RepID=A0ABS5J4H9_9BACT|nr:hypothetical protein [Chitinophaga hostae]MBS0029337.1 hypothetical protein [Chitinophaga hostae]